MTSLSTQLRNLQIPDTLSVGNLHDRKASILFKANEAADIDLDTIFSLGKNGLYELQEIDNDFARFEKTLFSENVKMLERTQQPKEFNERLDRKIKEFLVFLSPYFLIKPAQKTLEWLIRRFQVHVFNVDELMCCVLPFHQTNLFARVLNIITLNKQTEKWYWLMQTKRSGAPLPKSVLIQHCLSESSFLSFICQMLPQAIDIKKNFSLDKLKTLCSFYTGVLLGVAESSGNLTESRIGRMLPFLYQGLKSEMADYKASSYLLFTQICSVRTFTEQVISSFVDQICKTLSGETAKFGVLALECIFRNQKAKTLSTKALKAICSSKEIINLLDNLANEHALVSFQPVLLVSLFHLSLICSQSKELQDDIDYKELSVRFLQSMDLAPNGARYALSKLCEQYMKLKGVSADKESLLQVGQRYMQIFERRYPTETDLVLQTFTSKCKSNDETEWLQELLIVGQNNIKYRVFPGSETSLLLSLNHPDSGRRKLAVQELLRLMSSQTEGMEDHTFARSSLLQRLGDDDDSVVDEVLKGGKVLLKIIGEDAIIEQFEKKLSNRKPYNRFSLIGHLLTTFKDFESTKEMEKKASRIAFEVIQALLPSKQNIKKQMATWKLLLDSSFGCNNLFIEAFRAVLKDIDLNSFGDSTSLSEAIQETWVKLFDASSALVAGNVDGNSLVCTSVEYAVSANHDDSFLVFLVGVLFHLLDKLEEDRLLDLIDRIETFLRKSMQKAVILKGKSDLLESFQKSEDIHECFEKTLHKMLSRKREPGNELLSSFELFSILLRKIIQKIPPLCDGQQDMNVDKMTSIFELLACASGRVHRKRPFVGIFRFLLQEYLKTHFSSSKALLEFLSLMFMKPELFYFLTNASEDVMNIDLYICTLHLFKVCLETLCKDIGPFVTFECEVLPSLLVLLSHPLKIIREVAVGCIQSFHGNSVIKFDNGIKHLLDCLVDNDTEILEDHRQICNVLKRMFKPLTITTEDEEMAEPKHLEDLRLLVKYLSGFMLRSDINLKLGIASITASVDLEEYLVHLFPVIENLVKTAQVSGCKALSLSDFHAKLTIVATGLNPHEMKLLRILIKKFNARNVTIFDKDPTSLAIFKNALRLSSASFGSDASIQQECLEQITMPFYENIASNETRSKIFACLLDASINSNSSAIIKVIREKLIELPIGPDDIASTFSGLHYEPGASQAKKAKKTRSSTRLPTNQVGIEVIETPKWSETLLLLEVIQLKTNLTFNEKLILAIFDLLTFCLEITAPNQPSIEYMKQLLLSSLRRSIDENLKLPQRDTLPPEKFSIEKIIECFRTSENPQTHQQALLLLGRAAGLFPDMVLHNMMSIFTFMGTNVMRQDDSYSFEIIKHTIDAVIPTLVSAGSSGGGRSTGPNRDDIVKLVVRVFVDAVPYIPQHRRMLLFQHFTTVLGAESYLYIVVAMLLEKLLVQMDLGGDSIDTSDGSSLSQRFPFVLMKSFSFQEQATTVSNIIQFVATLPDEKQEEVKAKRVTRSIKAKESNQSLVPIFDAAQFSTKEIRRYKYRTLDFVSKAISDRDFADEAPTVSTSLENLFYHLLQVLLEYLCNVEKRAEEGEIPSTVKYWKFQLQKGGEILNKIYRLLKFDVFISITSLLIKSDNSFIRKKVIELIGEKVNSAQGFNHDEMLKLMGIANQLIALVKVDSTEMNANKQTALQVLRPLLNLLSNDHANDVADTANIFIDLFSSSEVHQQISANALLCIGELVLTLNVHMIKCLPQLMPPLISLLSDESQSKDIVLLNAFLTLEKIIDSLSKFMSPYVATILEILTSTRFGDSAEKFSAICTQIRAKVASIRGDLSRKIVPRVLFPALDSCFDKIACSLKHSLLILMEMAKEAIDVMPRDGVKAMHAKIFALFLKAFDIRWLYSERPEQEIEIAEDGIIAAFGALVMKMSENTFRPMFLKIFTWSTTSTEEKSARLVTFYHLCGVIALKLKGLFLLFAGHILKPAAELIAKCHVTNNGGSQLFGKNHESKTNSLLICIFDCLQRCFLHDSQGFLNKERFEYLMSPLVDQLDNDLAGTSYNNRVLDHLNPCLAYLAIAVNDESCWKTLNYQILLKTRNQNSQVRFAALKLLEEIHKHIGESYLILLPETIPFLAELMEDESFEVEKQCQHVISHMEEILGESLQKYF